MNEKELNDIEKIKKELLEQVSHHIRSPLTSIKNVIEDIASGVVTPNEDAIYKRYLAIARRSIRRLMQNVDSIFDLGALLDKERLPCKIFLDPQKTIESIISYYREINPGIDIELFVNNKDNLKLFADFKMLKTIFYKIFDNGVQYGGSKTKISIKCAVNSDESTITIENTGSSIAQNIKEKIFDNFVVEDYNVSGLGLGLSIAKKIVDLHGGRIRVEENENAQITFILPSSNSLDIVKDIIESERDRSLRNHEHLSIIRIKRAKTNLSLDEIEDNLHNTLRKKSDHVVKYKDCFYIFLRETDKYEAQTLLDRLNSYFVSSSGLSLDLFWSYPDDELVFEKDLYWG